MPSLRERGGPSGSALSNSERSHHCRKRGTISPECSAFRKSGRCGIGCEPASAATLAGIRKLTDAEVIAPDADVVAVLTGNVLKDADYIHQYHTGILKAPDGTSIRPEFGNPPVVLPNNSDEIAAFLGV